jgi:hypothetical protein
MVPSGFEKEKRKNENGTKQTKTKGPKTNKGKSKRMTNKQK